MKSSLTLAGFLLALTSVYAQEKLPPDVALHYAAVLTNYPKELRATPIPTHPDFSKPVGVRDEGYGGLVVPEQDLKAETIAKAGKQVVSVGQLWLVKLSPMVEDRAVPASKLHIVHVTHHDTEVDAACCALGVQKGAAGPELLVYGKGAEPLLRVPLKPITATQENPIDITAERTGDSGLLKLSFAGKYQASFSVTDPDQ